MTRLALALALAACGGTPCPAGRSAGALGACCLPGQTALPGVCVGAPTACPDAHDLVDGACVRRPLPPFRAVRVAPTTFVMGCDEDRDAPCGPDEGPAHEATPRGPYVIGATEVTQALAEALLGRNPSRLPGCPTCPVETISWNDAARLANALSAWEGLPPTFVLDGEALRFVGGPGWRLPTEVEWEHAARAGLHARYAGGDDRDGVAWHEGNAPGRTAPVATKAPNPWGLYDLSGNVWELTLTGPRPYPDAPEVDPFGPTDGRDVILRGGGWADMPDGLRVAYRAWVDRDHVTPILGLRLARDAHPDDAPFVEPAGPWAPPGP